MAETNEPKKDDEKKGFFDSLIDAVTNRDEKEAEAKAAAEKAEAEKQAAIEAARQQAAARNAAAAKAAAEKAAAEKAAADKAAAEKVAAAKAAAEKTVAEAKAAREKAAAEMAEAKQHAGGVSMPQGAPAMAQAGKKGVVQVASLRIRKDHTTKSGLAGGLVRGNEVTVLDTWSDGKDTWVKIGEDQWAAAVYDGETYIQIG